MAAETKCELEFKEHEFCALEPPELRMATPSGGRSFDTSKLVEYIRTHACPDPGTEHRITLRAIHAESIDLLKALLDKMDGALIYGYAVDYLQAAIIDSTGGQSSSHESIVQLVVGALSRSRVSVRCGPSSPALLAIDLGVKYLKASSPVERVALFTEIKALPPAFCWM